MKKASFIERALIVLLLITLLILAGVFMLRPIDDPDFFWHLKTGERIVSTVSLPDTDPFAYTNPDTHEPREKLILTSSWVTEVIYYAMYNAGGFAAIVFLRVMVFGFMFWFVFCRMRRKGVSLLFSITILSLSAISIFSTYAPDRPQIFSFLFAAFLLALMDSVGQDGRPRWVIVPCMILWANMHGGFIVGDLLLMLFAGGYIASHHRNIKTAVPVVLWAVAGVLASLVSPNTYMPFVSIFKFMSKGLSDFITEYKSTFEVFSDGEWAVASLWIFIAIYLTGFVITKRRGLHEIAVSLFLACFSSYYLRNIAFFTIALAPQTAYYGSMVLSRMSVSLRAAIGGRVIAGGIALLSLVAFISSLWGGETFFKRSVSSFYPVAASSFILDSGIKGNIFNDYDWGGYLIWRMYPTHQVFIDGRVIHMSVLEDYRSIGRGTIVEAQDGESYQTLLARYQVDFILQPLLRDNSLLQPLMKHILNDPNWIPVYLDKSSYVFVRSSLKNQDVLSRFAIDRVDFVFRLLGIFDERLRQSPSNVKNYIAAAKIRMYLGRNAEAMQVLERGRVIDPGNEQIREDLRLLSGNPNK